ncbi:MAG: YggT family protein [Chloroflexi bacterium]|nr:MAG: YggT family protein [Chloroflexota bacterium]
MLLVIQIIDLVFRIFYILVIARVILSWIRISPYHPTWGPLVRITYDLTEPIMAPIRRILPPMGGLDFTPFIVLILLSVVQQVLIGILAGF